MTMVALVEMERNIKKIFGDIINGICQWLHIARMTKFG